MLSRRMLRMDAAFALLLLLASRATGMAPFVREELLSRAPALAISMKSPLKAHLPLFHSHNDYEQDHPLDDAIRNGFPSVEADLWIEPDGRITVSHNGWFSKGTLEELYLRPLQKRVSQQGSVYGDGKPFYLWLDLKDDSPELTEALEKALSRYPMLSLFGGEKAHEGAVSVILTGSLAGKLRYVRLPGPRRATRDAELVLGDDPPADSTWSWYSLRWSDYFHWTGLGRMPQEERERFRTLLALAHAKGRKVRIYGSPESESYWREATEAGLDMIGTDSLARLRRFGIMRETSPGRAQVDEGRGGQKIGYP